jgi:hypothetical protein
MLKYIPPSKYKEALSHYSDNILTNVRSNVGKIYNRKTTGTGSDNFRNSILTTKDNKVKVLESFEDLMFFLPLAIEDPYSHH